MLHKLVFPAGFDILFWACMADVIRALADGFRARCGLRRTSPSLAKNEYADIFIFSSLRARSKTVLRGIRIAEVGVQFPSGPLDSPLDQLGAHSWQATIFNLSEKLVFLSLDAFQTMWYAVKQH